MSKFQVICKYLCLMVLVLIMTGLLTSFSKYLLVPILADNGMKFPDVKHTMLIMIPLIISLLIQSYHEIHEKKLSKFWNNIVTVGSNLSLLGMVGYVLNSSHNLVPSIIYGVFAFACYQLIKGISAIRHGNQ